MSDGASVQTPGPFLFLADSTRGQRSEIENMCWGDRDTAPFPLQPTSAQDSNVGRMSSKGNARFDRCQKRLCGWRVRPRNRRYQPWSTLHLSRSQKQTDFWPLLQQSQQSNGLVLWSADLVRHANRRSTRTALGALGDNDPTPRAHGPRAPLARSFDPFLSLQAMG